MVSDEAARHAGGVEAGERMCADQRLHFVGMLDEVRHGCEGGDVGVADVFAEAVVVAEMSLPPVPLVDELEDPCDVLGRVEGCDAGQPFGGLELGVRLAVVAGVYDTVRGPDGGAADEEADDPVRISEGYPADSPCEVAAGERVVLDDQTVRVGRDGFEAGSVASPGVRDGRPRLRIRDNRDIGEALEAFEERREQVVAAGVVLDPAMDGRIQLSISVPT